MLQMPPLVASSPVKPVSKCGSFLVRAGLSGILSFSKEVGTGSPGSSETAPVQAHVCRVYPYEKEEEKNHLIFQEAFGTICLLAGRTSC
jgi:hypothetical protein